MVRTCVSRDVTGEIKSRWHDVDLIDPAVMADPVAVQLVGTVLYCARAGQTPARWQSCADGRNIQRPGIAAASGIGPGVRQGFIHHQSGFGYLIEIHAAGPTSSGSQALFRSP